MSAPPNHFCPACGRPLEPFLRYPWHLCTDCRDRAVDGTGRALQFGNEGLSGGFMFRYTGDGDGQDAGGWIPCRAVIALVDGRPVHVTEARFGGVVAEPLIDRTVYTLDGVHDLRRGEKVTKPDPGPGPRGRPFSKG